MCAPVYTRVSRLTREAVRPRVQSRHAQGLAQNGWIPSMRGGGVCGRGLDTQRLGRLIGLEPEFTKLITKEVIFRRFQLV